MELEKRKREIKSLERNLYGKEPSADKSQRTDKGDLTMMNINNIQLVQHTNESLEDDNSIARDFLNKDLHKASSCLGNDLVKHSPINKDETLMLTSPDVEFDSHNWHGLRKASTQSS